MTDQLPDLPTPDTASLAYSGRSVDYISGYEAGFEKAADQMRQCYRMGVEAERERLVSELRGQTHLIAEFLYGHPRHKAVEWAKEDKYDSEADKAGEIIGLLAAAIRGTDTE